MHKKRIQIIYSGTVQGVGFRWTAERVALSLGVTGWVRNLSDGTVEVLAEGKEEDLVSLIDKIKKTMGHYICGSKVTWSGAAGEFTDFSIKFY